MTKKQGCPMLVRKCNCGRHKCTGTTPPKKIFDIEVCTSGDHKTDCDVFRRKKRELKKKLAESN